MGNRELSDFESNNLSILLYKVNRKIFLIKEAALKSVGITFPQSIALGYLHINEGRDINQKAIEEHMNLRSSSVNNLINNMIKKGFIVKYINKVDARNFDIKLTDLGREVALMGNNTFDFIDEKVITALAKEESEQLKLTLRKVLISLE